jgi:hypothetical protein
VRGEGEGVNGEGGREEEERRWRLEKKGGREKM